mgnify:CR=1 FL=1
MPTTDNITSNDLFNKLPKQHWVIHYGGALIIILIIALLTSLYYIKIPAFFLIELHPSHLPNHHLANSPKTDYSSKYLTTNKEIVMTLENGDKATFRIIKIEQQNHNFHLELEGIDLQKTSQNFLATEYISVGKVHKPSQPLIWSLISL